MTRPSDKGIADATRSQMFSSVENNKLIFFRPGLFLCLYCALGHVTAHVCFYLQLRSEFVN
jgi:hypothetical protein